MIARENKLSIPLKRRHAFWQQHILKRNSWSDRAFSSRVCQCTSVVVSASRLFSVPFSRQVCFLAFVFNALVYTSQHKPRKHRSCGVGYSVYYGYGLMGRLLIIRHLHASSLRSTSWFVQSHLNIVAQVFSILLFSYEEDTVLYIGIETKTKVTETKRWTGIP